MNDIIFSFTRAQAIADGFLIDVTETAREAGFRFTVALTHAMWAKYVEVPAHVTGQDEAGRLWDILSMLGVAIRAQSDHRSQVWFRLYVRNDNRRARLVTLKSICRPGDDAEPVITVMLPDED